jgi:hypothetical protein
MVFVPFNSTNAIMANNNVNSMHPGTGGHGAKLTQMNGVTVIRFSIYSTGKPRNEYSV